MNRKRKKRNVRSARKTAESRAKESGWSTKCFRVPEGVQLFKIDNDDIKKFQVLGYEIGADAGNPQGLEGEWHYEREYWRHRDVGPDEESYPCLKKTFGKKCPICDFRATLLKDPDADEKEVKALRPQKRQLFNVFDLDNPSEGIQLWDYSWHLFGKQLDARVENSDEDDGWDEFHTDDEDGLYVKVGWEEKKLGSNTFYQATTIDFKERSEELQKKVEELSEKTIDLDSLIIEYTYDELKAIFLAVKEDEEDEDKVRKPKDDEDEEPKRPKGGRRKRKEESKEESASTAEKESTEEKEVKDTTTDASRSKRRRRRKEEDKEEEKKQPVASDYGLEVDMQVDSNEWGEDCIIKKISKDGTAVYILDADDKKHSVAPDTLTIIQFDDDEEDDKSESKDDDEEWDDEWDD